MARDGCLEIRDDLLVLFTLPSSRCLRESYRPYISGPCSYLVVEFQRHEEFMRDIGVSIIEMILQITPQTVLFGKIGIEEFSQCKMPVSGRSLKYKDRSFGSLTNKAT